MSYKVLDAKGAQVGTFDLDPEVFAGVINEALVHEVVTWQRAKARAGTHSTLNRSKIEVTGRKLYKQKGTGRARHASKGSPLFVGGAVVFGPQPKSYEKGINKRQRKQALIAVLTEKAAGEKLVILDQLKSDGKTKSFAGIMKNLGIQTGGSLIVVADKKDVNIQRASKNIEKVTAVSVEGINVYDLLKHKFLVCTKAGVEALQQRVKAAK